MRYVHFYLTGVMIVWASLSFSQTASTDSLITDTSSADADSAMTSPAVPDSAQIGEPEIPDSTDSEMFPAVSDSVRPQLADSVNHVISSELSDDYGYNIFGNARLVFTTSFVYSPSANIKDEYIFPGYQFDAGVLWNGSWASDSLGFGFKAGLTRLSFEDSYTVPSLKFLDLQLLFLVTWGNLYRCPIMFQPHLGYSMVWGKGIGKKLCFTYGGRLFMKLPSFGNFRIFVDGQVVNTNFKNQPFSGTLAMIYFGVGYLH